MHGQARAVCQSVSDVVKGMARVQLVALES